MASFQRDKYNEGKFVLRGKVGELAPGAVVDVEKAGGRTVRVRVGDLITKGDWGVLCTWEPWSKPTGARENTEHPTGCMCTDCVRAREVQAREVPTGRGTAGVQSHACPKCQTVLTIAVTTGLTVSDADIPF